MDPGKLRTLLTIERNDPSRSPSGQVSDAWKLVCRARFYIEGQSGTENARGPRVEANYSHKMTCRYFAGANAKMRLRRDSRIFEVVSVNNVEEKNRFLVWLVNEVV